MAKVPQAATVEEFRRLAQEYVRLIDRHDRYLIRHFLQKLDVLLPALYACGVCLPRPVPKTRGSAPRLTYREWRRIYSSLRRKLGNRDKIRQVFDEYDREDRGVVIGSLADDLADTYGDVLHGLRCWNDGERIEEDEPDPTL